MTGLLALSAASASPAGLEVTQAGPAGEIAQLSQAAEIRIAFSEPMVALGRIPKPVTAPFLRITPAIEGSLRWSDTRTLVFTPDDPEALPYSSRFRVRIDTTATAVSGQRLARPYSFEFVTPTLRLLRVNWQRQEGRYDRPLLLYLRFNQPVRRRAVLPHLRFALEPHDWTAPPPPEASAPADAGAVRADFDTKVARVRETTSSRAVVAVAATAKWDTRTFPASPDLVVLRTTAAPPTDAWIKVAVGAKAPGAQGMETPGSEQAYTVKLEPTFFVDGMRCHAGCDPQRWNPLRLRARVAPRTARAAVAVVDVTEPGREAPLAPAGVSEEHEEEPAYERSTEGDEYDVATEVTLEDLGFRPTHARTYRVTVRRDLEAKDGQRLGYDWTGTVENWHLRAFTSFGGGHGVWESAGGSRLPFYARNLRSVSTWMRPLTLDELVPAMKALQESGFRQAPAAASAERTLQPRPDVVESHGLELRPFLSARNTALLWAALRDGDPIPRAHEADTSRPVRSTLVQVTNLGLSVKDSPRNTLVFVTRLDTGAPVEGARVAIRDLENEERFVGVTGRDGVAEFAGTALRDPEQLWTLGFVVTAEKDGDVAYVGSDWREGLEPWEFGIPVDLDEAKPLLRGAVFADRGVYKLGEEVRLKAVLRGDAAEGIALLPSGTAVKLVVKDTQGEEVAAETLTLGEWSSADWTLTLPANGPLGSYGVTATATGYERPIDGSFLVAAYRRPEFRVEASLAAESTVAGVALEGRLAGRYLFGAPMSDRPVRWTYSKRLAYGAPSAVAERFPDERWAFLDREGPSRPPTGVIETKEVELDERGELALELPTPKDAGDPYEYTLEGEVTDVSRQRLAGRASFRVDPAPWYVALRRPPYFTDAAGGLDTEVLAVGLDGRPVAGVAVSLTLTQIQWHSVRRAEGGGFYTWETERREVAAGEWHLDTTEAAQPLHVPLPAGGYFVLRATARDDEGRWTATAVSFYGLGAGYTAWARADHNRIELVPERKTYRPGETARIMVKSPWEKATALLTTEREGIRTRRVFELASTQETVEVPLTEADIPNLYVSVLLVKGRSEAFGGDDQSDPGKPSFRLGYAQLDVEDAAKRLEVEVASDREEYRPGAKARVEVTVKDRRGQPARAEVTLWAVDVGVLSLTGYQAPDVVSSVYVHKALQVLNEDSRQRIISRRAVVPKGGAEGGGGGEEGGAEAAIRRDFRVLAFWLGSLATDADGRARTEVTLPESLTAYRIMAVAADTASRFGRGSREIRISKPLLLRSAFPRFLARGDTATFGAVVTNQLPEGGAAVVTMRSLDPAVLEVPAEASQALEVKAGGTAEVRFPVVAKAVGRARVQMTVRLGGESDAFEEAIPVRVLLAPEVVAAHGQTKDAAVEKLQIPSGVLPAEGGLHLELASTALVGLGEGARYLVEYPYGCAEQRSSAALALMLAADLGQAFRLPGLDPGAMARTAQSALDELPAFQCEGGGFSFWKGECSSVSPFLTSYVLHVLQRGVALRHSVKPSVLDKGYAYLEGVLGEPAPVNEGWWPSHTAWQAFAVKVLAEGSRNVDSHLARLYEHRDRMPVFALAFLRDGFAARGEKSERTADLDRRLRNAILPEGGSAHVEETADPYLLWFWNSNVRSTAIVTATIARTTDADPLLPGLVRWLLAVRQKGRWSNTQENAWALGALVDYYRRHEAEEPDFTALVELAAAPLMKEELRGRTSETRSKDLPMRELLARGPAGTTLDLAFRKDGPGTLYYTARLKYVADDPAAAAVDQGLRVTRSYARADGAPATSFEAGELVEVTLELELTKERRFVAVVDPLPAGLEPVESWFATTASDVARSQQDEEGRQWVDWWERGGFDHVERHDDRVQLFATRLEEGRHSFSYRARATTSGTFRTAPARAEEMYEPEIFGRGETAVIDVKP